jgi:hypothetical protein
MALPLKLQLAEGFREVPPRACGRQLLWEENGEFKFSPTDFSAPRTFGHLGGVDCPLAVDATRGVAWAYCCQYRLGVRDYSEIREFDLATGRSRRVLRLGLRQWALWLLDHWTGSDSLLALVATDTRTDAIFIRHHLAVINTKTAQLHLIALPRDAFAPLASCQRRRWLIFHGAEGTHLVSYTGRNLLTLPPGGPLGRGGDIHPHQPLALLGGDGIWLWNLETGALRRLRDRGQYPRWTPDGASCWFSESSSDLFQMHCETGAETRLLRVAGNAYTEVNYARPILADAAGRYLALPLTRLLKMDPLAAAHAPTLARMHKLCVVDLEAKETWLTEGYARHLAWA